MITFNEIKEDEKKVRLDIEPGVHENVVILDIEEPEDANYLVVKFGQEDKKLYTKWYTSEEVKEGKDTSAMDVALRKAKHLASQILTDEEKESIKADNAYKLLKLALSKCVGKSLRMKFIGEEFLRQDGTIGVQTKIGFAPFAESMDIKLSKLKFNKDNPYDYKRIPVVEVKNSDNPFV